MTMLRLALLLLAFPAVTLAAPRESPLMAPIHRYIDGFNRGDMALAGSAFTPDATIVDEVGPFVWRAPTALADWARQVAGDAAKYGATAEHATLGAPTRADVSGDDGYVVVPETFFYKDHGGRAMREDGVRVCTLHKGPDGWRITAAAWAGGTPHPATRRQP